MCQEKNRDAATFLQQLLLMRKTRGQRLLALREKSGLTLKEIEVISGLVRQTINRIEGDTVDPQIGTLKSLLKAYGLGLAEFFSEEERVQFRTPAGVVIELEPVAQHYAEVIIEILNSEDPVLQTHMHSTLKMFENSLERIWKVDGKQRSGPTVNGPVSLTKEAARERPKKEKAS